MRIKTGGLVQAAAEAGRVADLALLRLLALQTAGTDRAAIRTARAAAYRAIAAAVAAETKADVHTASIASYAVSGNTSATTEHSGQVVDLAAGTTGRTVR
jgi:hypothetical protein